jgi:hypothetical protein
MIDKVFISTRETKMDGCPWCVRRKLFRLYCRLAALSLRGVIATVRVNPEFGPDILHKDKELNHENKNQ